MYMVLYKCLYREYWYEGPETTDWNQAYAVAQQIKAQRRCPVVIRNEYTGEVFAC